MCNCRRGVVGDEKHIFLENMAKRCGSVGERGWKQVFLSCQKKEHLAQKWMSRPAAPTPCEPISTLEVVVCGSLHRVSTDVSQVLIKLQHTATHCNTLQHTVSHVLIKLPPPPHIHGLLQKHSSYISLLVRDGSLSGISL